MLTKHALSCITQWIIYITQSQVLFKTLMKYSVQTTIACRLYIPCCMDGKSYSVFWLRIFGHFFSSLSASWVNAWLFHRCDALRRARTETFVFHFHALEKEMATHSSVLSLRIPGMGEPEGLPSVGVTQSWTWLKRLSSSSSRTERRPS